VVIVARPTALKMPRWMRPIKAVACGSSHAMALTDLGQIYSWGCGSYGALGFGTREDVYTPKVMMLA
jgi:alpha-tubulin suppressor-like RCC1 family protein